MPSPPTPTRDPSVPSPQATHVILRCHLQLQHVVLRCISANSNTWSFGAISAGTELRNPRRPSSNNRHCDCCHFGYAGSATCSGPGRPIFNRRLIGRNCEFGLCVANPSFLPLIIGALSKIAVNPLCPTQSLFFCATKPSCPFEMGKFQRTQG